MTKGPSCTEPGCTGRVAADGYCDTCGTKAAPAKRPVKAPAAKAAAAPPAAPVSAAAPSTSRPGGATTGTLVTGSARSSGSRRGGTSRTTSRRTSSIGAGIVDVPPAAAADPASVILASPVVAENKRFCSKCGAPVGRSRPDNPQGRTSGICSQCRHRFDFEPKLQPGTIVGGQYEVAGCLAHGGLGWIYLARDKAVNGRWSVMKGLLDSGDEAAMRVAVAERQFLAELSHPGIVEIFNFVTHQGSGYIVMEYVGGPSLKQILRRRQEAAGGKPDPLPVEQALAYVLAILPAFAYLHSRAIVYCDFKPDNLIQIGGDVRMIDMGAVRRIDDTNPDVYGTVGFQAPEIATDGPSVASDIYTIGRTLAVLTLDFKGYQKELVHSLPDPADHPGLQFDSFHRLLLKATAPHPDDRFQTVAELGDQMLGVMREVVALRTGRSQPTPSTVFGPAPDDGSLPSLAIDPADPAAAFLANLVSADPRAVMAEIDAAVATGQLQETIEVRLRRARASIDTGKDSAPATRSQLDRIEAEDPWEWRSIWLRGILALATGDLVGAAAAFDRCRSEVPGEVAPKLAAAITAERAGQLDVASRLYDTVVQVDPSYIAATRGLARSRAAAGDVTGALAAFDRIPTSHRARAAAQIEAVRMLTAAGRFAEAETRLAHATLDGGRRAQLEAELFVAARHRLTDGAGQAGVAFPPSLGGQPFTVRGLSLGLERALLRQARFAATEIERYALVDRATAERPLTVL